MVSLVITYRGSRILDLVGQRMDLLPLGMVALPLGMVDR